MTEAIPARLPARRRRGVSTARKGSASATARSDGRAERTLGAARSKKALDELVRAELDCAIWCYPENVHAVPTHVACGAVRGGTKSAPPSGRQVNTPRRTFKSFLLPHLSERGQDALVLSRRLYCDRAKAGWR